MPILPRRNKGVREKLSPNTPPPLPVILSVVSLSVGFALSYPPLKTDSDYFTATKRGSAEMIQEVAQRPTTNAFLLSKATEAVLNAGMGDASKELVGILIDRFPRSLYGQLVKYERYSSTEVDRVKSLANLKEIDPIVALCFGPTPEARLRYEIERLPARQRYELARGWGLVGNKSTREVETFTWTQVSQSDLALKLSSYCGRG
jgi:hypothetical protein